MSYKKPSKKFLYGIVKENDTVISKIMNNESIRKRINNGIENTVKYNDVRELTHPKKNLKQLAIVDVIFEDTADLGYYLLQEGLNPLVLNMSSNTTPGGGWRNGAIAQEEALFYRSTYHLSLENPEFYPLNTYNAVYSPDVYFFRENQSQSYNILKQENCCFLSCVAMPAIKKPSLRNNEYRPSDRRRMKEKIKGVFKIALKHGHDSLVLGALGCGAYKNPPYEVAKIFLEVIKEYRSYFKRISFAILDFGRSNNYEIFSNVLEQLKSEE